MRGVMRPEVNDVAPYLKRTGAKLTCLPRRRATTSVTLVACATPLVHCVGCALAVRAGPERLAPRPAPLRMLAGIMMSNMRDSSMC